MGTLLGVHPIVPWLHLCCPSDIYKDGKIKFSVQVSMLKHDANQLMDRSPCPTPKSFGLPLSWTKQTQQKNINTFYHILISPTSVGWFCPTLW